MKYHEGDKFVLDGIECMVAFVSSHGRAFLVSLNDGDYYGSYRTMKGVVFAILDGKGRDSLGNKALPIIKQECGAV